MKTSKRQSNIKARTTQTDRSYLLLSKSQSAINTCTMDNVRLSLAALSMPKMSSSSQQDRTESWSVGHNMALKLLEESTGSKSTVQLHVSLVRCTVVFWKVLGRCKL